METAAIRNMTGPQCDWNEELPADGKSARKVNSPTSRQIQNSLQPAVKKELLDLGHWTGQSFSNSERCSVISTWSSDLWHEQRLQSVSGCFVLWSRGRPYAEMAGRMETNSLCIEISHSDWAKVCTSGKRGVGSHMGVRKIQRLSHWEALWNGDRSQAITESLRSTSSGCSSPSYPEV